MGDVEPPEDAEIPLRDAGALEDVEAAVSEPRLGHRGEGERIEVRVAAADSAKNLDGALHPVGHLRVAGRVQRCPRGGDGERTSAEEREDVVHLPPADEGGERAAAVQPPPSLAERQLRGRSNVQRMPAIEPAPCAVQIVELRYFDRRPLIAVIRTRNAHRLRERVIDVDGDAITQTAAEPRLQRVVMRVADRRDQDRWRRAPEAGEHLPPRAAAADRRVVLLPLSELIDLPRPDIRRFANKAPLQLLLVRGVP